MKVLDVFSEGFDILVDCIRCHTPNLHQPVVLDENCVTGQVAVDYWGVATERKLISYWSSDHQDFAQTCASMRALRGSECTTASRIEGEFCEHSSWFSSGIASESQSS